VHLIVVVKLTEFETKVWRSVTVTLTAKTPIKAGSVSKIFTDFEPIKFNEIELGVGDPSARVIVQTVSSGQSAGERVNVGRMLTC